MSKTIVIAGGTGFIGDFLTKKFTILGYEFFIISRMLPHIRWQESSKTNKKFKILNLELTSFMIKRFYSRQNIALAFILG